MEVSSMLLVLFDHYFPRILFKSHVPEDGGQLLKRLGQKSIPWLQTKPTELRFRIRRGFGVELFIYEAVKN
jgi:hypothetical protein